MSISEQYTKDPPDIQICIIYIFLGYERNHISCQ